MRIACLQFSPQVGQVCENMARADQLLQGHSAGDFDLLVLPEMAFSGMYLCTDVEIESLCEPVKKRTKKECGECLCVIP